MLNTILTIFQKLKIEQENSKTKKIRFRTLCIFWDDLKKIVGDTLDKIMVTHCKHNCITQKMKIGKLIYHSFQHSGHLSCNQTISEGGGGVSA